VQKNNPNPVLAKKPFQFEMAFLLVGLD